MSLNREVSSSLNQVQPFCQDKARAISVPRIAKHFAASSRNLLPFDVNMF